MNESLSPEPDESVTDKISKMDDEKVAVNDERVASENENPSYERAGTEPVGGWPTSEYHNSPQTWVPHISILRCGLAANPHLKVPRCGAPGGLCGGNGVECMRGMSCIGVLRLRCSRSSCEHLRSG